MKINSLGLESKYKWAGAVGNQNSTSPVEDNKSTDSSIKSASQSPRIKEIDKAIQSLKDRIQDIKNSDLSEEEIKAQVETLENQIKMLESQKQQIQIEEKKKQVEEKNEDIREKQKEKEVNYGEVNKAGVVVSDSLNELIKADSKRKEVRDLKITSTSLKIEVEYLEDSSDTEYNKKTMLKLNKGILGLELTINNAAVDIYKAAKKAEEESVDDNEKDNGEDKNINSYA